MTRRVTNGILLAMAGLALTGCVSRPRGLTAEHRAVLCARAAVHFETAGLAKPAESAAIPAIVLQFAPLIIQETEARSEHEGVSGWFDLPRQVFFSTGWIQMNGKACQQISYCWSYDDTGRASQATLPAQGVRITLDTGGKPVIWEALADTSGAALLFVSQALELAASREFGPPQAGRRFAVERTVRETPRVVVAGLVDDAPVPMGPIMHLLGATHDVAVVACRCAPTQARKLANQQEYVLIPPDRLTDGPRPALFRRESGPSTGCPCKSQVTPINRLLRLPQF